MLSCFLNRRELHGLLSIGVLPHLSLVLELVDRDQYCRKRPLLGKFGSFGEGRTNGLGYGSEYCLA